MSEPVVMTVTSIALVGNEIPNALGFGLWGSLHAVAASTTTNAAARPLRPTVRVMRHPPGDSVLRACAPRRYGQKTGRPRGAGGERPAGPACGTGAAYESQRGAIATRCPT